MNQADYIEFHPHNDERQRIITEDIFDEFMQELYEVVEDCCVISTDIHYSGEIESIKVNRYADNKLLIAYFPLNNSLKIFQGWSGSTFENVKHLIYKYLVNEKNTRLPEVDPKNLKKVVYEPNLSISTYLNQSVFDQGQDFMSVTAVTDMPNGGVKPIQDYYITIDMAKQLCLMSHTEKGKQYRRYLIAIERKWNDPQEIVKRGYAILQSKNTQLTIENREMKPKALFADAVSASNKTILIGDLAKILKQNGVNIGSVRLFRWLRKHGYLIKRDASDYNMPTQKSMERSCL